MLHGDWHFLLSQVLDSSLLFSVVANMNSITPDADGYPRSVTQEGSYRTVTVDILIVTWYCLLGVDCK